MQTIPLTADPSQTLRVFLGATKLLMAVRYNDASGVWNFDISRDSDGVMLLSNVPILIGQDLLGPYALGLGGLIASDSSGQFEDAGPDDMGARVTLLSLSTAEVSALKDAGAIL